MRKMKNKIFVLFLTIFLSLGSLPLPLMASRGSSDFSRVSGMDEENYLNIGIPDFPRRVKKELPEVSKERGIDAGIMKLHPSFSTSFEFDDNIELSNEDRTKEKRDGIFVQKPGLAGEMKVGNHRFEGGYGMEIHNFAKYEEENKINHLAYGLGEFNFNDFRLLIEDNLEKSTNRRYSETSTRDHLLLNEVHVLGRYDRPKWASELGWTHNTVNHLTDELELSSYNEDIIALLGGYKILPKTLLLTEFDWGNVYYDKKIASADQTYIQILGGLRGDLTEDWMVTVKGGLQNRQLDDVLNEGPQTDYVGFVANADTTYNLTKSDMLRLGYARAVKTSTFQTSSWYREDKIYFSYRRRLFDRWFLTPSTSWQFNDYPEAATVGSQTLRRRDSFWQAGASLRYKITDWAWTGIAYNFRTRDSNFNSMDYNSNRLTVDLSFIY